MARIERLSLAFLTLTIAGVAADRYLATPKAGSQPVAPPPVPVVTAPVRQSDVPILLSGIGTVRALNVAVIRSQVTGLLQSIDFVEGQPVKKDDLLAQIDPRLQQAALQQAQAQLSRDQAHLTNAQTNLSRNLPLLNRGFATDQQVTDEQAQIAQLQNDVKSDAAAIDNANTQLSYTSLVAPFDGVTGVRALDVGNVIHPADADGLVTVTQVQPISVLFTLPSGDIPLVQAALDAGAVPAIAYDQSDTRELDQGKLLLINNQADPQSGTVQLKATFPNLKRLLWPGAFVNIELTLRTVPNGLTVPTDAVQQGADGPFVYLVGAGGKVTVRPVEVDQRAHGMALVSKGLQANQTVVTQGQYRLTDGTVVTAAKRGDVSNVTLATSGLLP